MRPVLPPARGHASKHNSEARGNVTDGIKSLVVAHDLEHVGRIGSGQPPASIDGDAQVAPVFHPRLRRAVNQDRTCSREELRGFEPDNSPVADGEHAGVLPGRQAKSAQQRRDALEATSVLDVEEHHPFRLEDGRDGGRGSTVSRLAAAVGVLAVDIVRLPGEDAKELSLAIIFMVSSQ